MDAPRRPRVALRPTPRDFQAVFSDSRDKTSFVSRMRLSGFRLSSLAAVACPGPGSGAWFGPGSGACRLPSVLRIGAECVVIVSLVLPARPGDAWERGWPGAGQWLVASGPALSTGGWRRRQPYILFVSFWKITETSNWSSTRFLRLISGSGWRPRLWPQR